MKSLITSQYLTAFLILFSPISLYPLIYGKTIHPTISTTAKFSIKIFVRFLLFFRYELHWRCDITWNWFFHWNHMLRPVVGFFFVNINYWCRYLNKGLYWAQFNTKLGIYLLNVIRQPNRRKENHVENNSENIISIKEDSNSG